VIFFRFLPSRVLCAIIRDPRFGRNSELPGEDPLLSGTYATEMVNGMQERDAHGYPKMAALLKHFTA
jgi:beta-glucosidase-like glycosyl hydrolase